jgi:hypothetical protein
MDCAETYVWLDVIKKKLIDDAAPDNELEAIEEAQKIIREKVTGYSEE